MLKYYYRQAACLRGSRESELLNYLDLQKSVEPRSVRTLRARWRELETEPRTRLNGHEGGNLGYSPSGVPDGPPRQFPTLPSHVTFFLAAADQGLDLPRLQAPHRAYPERSQRKATYLFIPARRSSKSFSWVRT